ncbi:hypothetical protein [uncultured Aquimarina sp.]|uniref:hypothetical protein n=1 Tax=uncultured Aquimarina sp. TaxID=575652 RepID=UPI0026196C44|nr:hypothetical protein [uncultured Aquimarina sp.]
MTVSEFNSLGEGEQHRVLFNTSVFIHSINKPIKHYVLYSLKNFYVEVIYNVGINKITSMKAFEEGMLLDKFAIAIQEEF